MTGSMAVADTHSLRRHTHTHTHSLQVEQFVRLAGLRQAIANRDDAADIAGHDTELVGAGSSFVQGPVSSGSNFGAREALVYYTLLHILQPLSSSITDDEGESHIMVTRARVCVLVQRERERATTLNDLTSFCTPRNRLECEQVCWRCVRLLASPQAHGANLRTLAQATRRCRLSGTTPRPCTSGRCATA